MPRSSARVSGSKVVTLFVTAVCCLFLCRPANADIYQVIDLGTLGGTESAAYGINTAGRVVGEANLGGGATHGFRTTPYMSIVGASDLGLFAGGDASWARAINDPGDAVGAATASNGHHYAFLVLADGTRVSFAYLGGVHSDAESINTSRYIVGRAILDDGFTHAIMITPGGQGADLQSLGGSFAAAMCINKSGVIVGGSNVPDGTRHAFKTSFYSVIHPGYDDLGQPGRTSFAYAVNNNGVVVGHSEDDARHILPCRWTGKTLQFLGSIGGREGTAYGINSAGAIVGECLDVFGNFHAFICQPGSQMKDLNDLVNAPNWVLQTARSINDSGAVVGEGLLAGSRHAFLLRPIVPAGFTITPNKIAGSLTATGKVTLNYIAPFDVVVDLKDKHLAADAPASVTVPAGTISATFPITTFVVTADSVGAFGAVFGGVTKSALLTVMPVSVKTLTFSPASIVGCKNGKGYVTLEAPAAPGDITVSLTSADTSIVEVPASVTVPAGSTGVAFAVATHPVAATTFVTVSATANGRTKTTKLTVKPIPPRSLTISPNKVKGGGSAVGTVTLECPAGLGSITVTLSSSSAHATVPTSIIIPVGVASKSFNITTTAVLASTTATISATANGVTKTATLTIVP